MRGLASYEQTPPSALAGVRALVVEDDLELLELLEVVLSSAGADVRTASSAEEALERLRTFEPSVLVSDIGMPGRDGYWLVREVRKLKRDLPAIAVTAFTRAVDVESARSAGFDKHLGKPVHPTVLVKAVACLTTAERS